MAKITYQNNWESHVYSVDGKPSTSFRYVYLNGERYDVCWSKVSQSYSDHGHTYDAVSFECYVPVPMFDITIDVALSALISKGVAVTTD